MKVKVIKVTVDQSETAIEQVATVDVEVFTMSEVLRVFTDAVEGDGTGKDLVADLIGHSEIIIKSDTMYVESVDGDCRWIAMKM